MDSMSALFAPDIDYITKSGIWFRGKEQAIWHNKNNQETIFKYSTLTIDSVHIKYVMTDLAIMHVGWGMSGDTHHDGKPSEPRHGLSTFILIKKKSQWLLLGVQNVNIVKPE
jgi:hypothetical protein